MHPVANEVPIPVEAIERELAARAVPGFTGQVKIHLRVREEAGLAVGVVSETVESQGTARAPAMIPWKRLGNESRHEPTERELKVKTKVAENRHRFTIGTKVTQVVGYFADGNLNRFDLVTVG